MNATESSLLKTAAAIIIIAGAIAFITLGKTILIPLILALLLWFVMHKLNSLLVEIAYLERNLSKSVMTIFSGLIVLMVVIALGTILSDNISSLRESYEKYRLNFGEVIQQLDRTFNIDTNQMLDFRTSDLKFSKLFSNLLNSLTNVVSSLFMVIVYAAFIAAEESSFTTKISKIFLNHQKYNEFQDIVKKVDKSVSHYLGLKSLVSLITGVASYAALRLLGIESAGFWAFLIVLLNFIPTIGSLIATIFPAIFAVLQFVDIWPGVYVLAIVGIIQIIVGNAFEPKLMGNSLNISPLVTILSLSIWGLMWGIMGMILSVPITVVMIIIMSNFPKTRKVAILLSEKGNIY